MTPYAQPGAYINFMMKEVDGNVKAAFGENYERLVALKQKYDPENFFHLNQNIKP
jgi:FAD/FMN-containing dehydrogenase